MPSSPHRRSFPRHRAAASLKPLAAVRRLGAGGGFPRHRAAASLKHEVTRLYVQRRSKFSAASGRGLIEADRARQALEHHFRFPRHRAAASLKQRARRKGKARGKPVFRGIGPRPH